MLQGGLPELEEPWPPEAEPAERTDYQTTMMDAESEAAESMGEMVMHEIEAILGEISSPKVPSCGRSAEAGDRRSAEEAGLLAELFALSMQRPEDNRGALALFNTTLESSVVTSEVKEGPPIVGIFYGTCATVGVGGLTADDERLMQDILDNGPMK